MIHLTEAEFTDELCKELVEQYGSISAAAQVVASKCSSARYSHRPVSWYTVKRWISRHVRSDSTRTEYTQNTSSDGPERILDAARIKSATVGTYEVVTKDADGVSHKHLLTKSSLSLVPDVPEFPLIQCATPTTIVYNAGPYINHPIRRGVVVSDVQYGYLRDTESGELEPIHDPAAIACAKSIVASVRPSSLYFIGDFVDWPTFSRWQKYPEFYGVLQPTIDGGYQELGEFIAAAGKQCEERIMIGSNHLVRFQKFILDYNMDALGLRRANTTPDSWPVFSEQYLLRYDDLGISFSGQYPGGLYYITDGLALNHAPTQKLEVAADVIHGHTHHLGIKTWAQHTSKGRKNYFLYDCGCLCQLGSTSNSRRLLQTRVPSDRARTDWAQGIAVTNILPTKIPKHSVDLIKIEDGMAIYEGQIYGAQETRS